VFDRYNDGGGPLLAAGIAYNTLFALVPMALFAGGLLGAVVTDPDRSASVRDALTDWAPPLADVIDEILDGLATASPSLSAIGCVGMIWGSTRLFASLETGFEAMFAGVPRRGIVARTVRRVASVLAIAAVVGAAVVATSLASLVAELAPVGGSAGSFLVSVELLVLPVLTTSLALATVYRLVPPVRPRIRAVAWPSLVIGVAIVVVTRLFAILAPRLLGNSFVYGTLGAIFVALAWLGLAYSLVLIGAAWVRERMLAEEPVVEAPVA
jgi:membrane protein